MKILIIGHSVEDHIHSTSNDEEIKPGGIYYTTAAMNIIKNNDDEIYLCTSIQKDNFHLFEPVYKNINPKYFQYVPQIPKVHLYLNNNNERTEKYENITNKLSIPFNDLNSFDGILINMITGFDISIEDIIKIRDNYWKSSPTRNGKIFFDVHTLSRGLNENMIREFRKIPDINKWFNSIDILQSNENETLTFFNSKNEDEIVEEVLNHNVKIFLITKGNKGVRLFTKVNNEIISLYEEGIKVEVKNKVGCGDILGSIFFYYYLKDKNLEKALKLANIAAGISVSYFQLDELNKLKNDIFTRYNQK
ncbi:MAG: hypothetical protein STSR0008_16780 [Ignavibacterium sp.]